MRSYMLWWAAQVLHPQEVQKGFTEVRRSFHWLLLIF